MIYYPKIYGTCTGANKAIEMAYKLKKEFHDKNIYIYKEVLHNEFIINELKSNGIYIINNLDDVSENDILILRAHGESKNVYEELKKRNINYYDATCINVSKIHDLINSKYNEGYKIIIVGKKNHPEVIGSNGWCNNSAIIIENEKDYDKLNKNEKYYVIAQTTIANDDFDKLINYLNNDEFNYIFDNTICNYQKVIQDSAINLSKEMDIMIIIGGENSSNTKVLFNECSKYCESYFFSNIKDFYSFIKTKKYKIDTKIGITGGASTPKTQIYEFAHLLEFYINYSNRKNDIIKEVNKVNKTFIKSENKVIKDSINKFINMNSDGKYLRGFLIDLGYKLSKDDNYALPLEAAYETFETAILIHDDIIDLSKIRRGKTTIHEEYSNEFKKYKYVDNTPTSLGICIGDLGFFFTNQILINNYKNDKNLSKLLNYYNEIVIDTIKGEILDVYLPYIEKNDKNHILKHDDIFEIYKLKTSKYTIVGPFVLGMILANRSQKEINKFEKILEPLGYSFQIKDDILGIFSKNEILGKSVYSDIEEFKQTILYSYIKINKPEYLEELLKYYGNSINENDLEKVKDILTKSGALEYANNKMNELFFKTKHDINNLDINESVKNILLGFITYLEMREK